MAIRRIIDIIPPIPRSGNEKRPPRIKKYGDLPKFLVGCLALLLVVQMTAGSFPFSINYAHAAGTTYYVDNAITDVHVASAIPDCTTYDPTTFTCGGGSASAYATIADINASTFQPDDQILFRKGETWREELDVPSSGTSGHPITFGAFGVGAAPKITGADAIATSSWTLATSTAQTYQATLSTNPGSYVLENGTLLAKEASTSTVDATAGSFYWASNVLYVHAFDSSNPKTNGKIYETPIRPYAATIWGSASGRDYITFDGLDLEMPTQFAIAADKGDDFTLENSTIRYTGSIAIWVSDNQPTNAMTLSGNTFNYTAVAAYLNGDDDSIASNTFENTGRVLEVRDDVPHSKNFLIEGNYFLDDGDSTETNCGILIDGDTNGTNSEYSSGIIRYNYIKNCTGRPIDGFYGDTEISYNIIDHAMLGAAGSDVSLEVNGPNNKIYNNTIIDPANIGLFINSNPVAGNVPDDVENNIIYDTSATTNHIIYVSAGVTSNPILKNNLYYNAPGGIGAVDYNWKGTDYSFANWQAQSSEASSMEADPLLVNAASGDFTLSSTSPAIDAGADIGSSYQLALAPSASWPSSVSTINQNSNGKAWDIGAYVYTQSTAPTVSLSSPSTATIGTTQALSATASAAAPAAIASVKFQIDGTTIGTVSSAPYTYSWNTTGSAVGSHTITAIATDTYGNTASSQATVVLDAAGNGPPVGLLSPNPSPAQTQPSSSGIPASPSTSSSVPEGAATSSPPSTAPNAPAPSTSSAATIAEQVATTTPSHSEVQAAINAMKASYWDPTFRFTRHLAKGKDGMDVVELQDMLRALHYFPVSVPSTGYFWTITEQAVLNLQRAAGIAPVGEVGPITRALLNSK